MILSSRSSFPIWLLDEKGAVIAANPDALRMLEYTAAELYSLNFFSDIVSPLNSQLAVDISHLQDKESIKDFLRFETNRSYCLDRKCSITQVKDRTGQKIYIVHEIEEEAIHEAEKVFFNTIFHEMLGLFQKIISNLESISSSETPPEYTNQLERIIQNIDKHALAMKKIEFLTFSEEEVDILTKLENLKLKYEIHPSKNINISIQSDEKIQIKIHPLFAKVLEIILDNAIEYTENKNVEITIGLKQKVDNLKITITDKGIGVPPQYRERVFEKYFKVPGSGKGSGLGLYLAKKIIEMFKGSIKITNRVEGQPYQGTRFIIELPY
jgi:signal transduction histidine kinase